MNDLKKMSSSIAEAAKSSGITDPQDLIAFALGFKTAASSKTSAEDTGFKVNHVYICTDTHHYT